MKKRDSENDDMLRAVELILQAIAIGLCALILLNMSVEKNAGIPTHMCIESGPGLADLSRSE